MYRLSLFVIIILCLSSCRKDDEVIEVLPELNYGGVYLIEQISSNYADSHLEKDRVIELIREDESIKFQSEIFPIEQAGQLFFTRTTEYGVSNLTLSANLDTLLYTYESSASNHVSTYEGIKTSLPMFTSFSNHPFQDQFHGDFVLHINKTDYKYGNLIQDTSYMDTITFEFSSGYDALFYDDTFLLMPSAFLSYSYFHNDPGYYTYDRNMYFKNDSMYLNLKRVDSEGSVDRTYAGRKL